MFSIYFSNYIFFGFKREREREREREDDISRNPTLTISSLHREHTKQDR
jgi:hypothetical protein